MNYFRKNKQFREIYCSTTLWPRRKQNVYCCKSSCNGCPRGPSITTVIDIHEPTTDNDQFLGVQTDGLPKADSFGRENHNS